MRSEFVARAFQLQARHRVASSMVLATLRPQRQTRSASLAINHDIRTSQQCIRHFSMSRTFAAVHVTNPRQDEEGRDKVIEITSRASKRLSEIMTKDSNPDLALRVTVESGGCHGFQYLMSLTNAKEMDADEDILFEADDGSGAKVVMDEPSLDLLQGSKVDYTMELIGSQFKIVGNPKASSSCGCGTSFDIKM